MQDDDKRIRIKKAWGRFLSGWPFQWVAHLSFKRVPEKAEAEKRVKLWTRDICREEGLRVGYISIYNDLKRAHLHSLMLSKEDNDGKTLRDIKKDKWAAKWNHGQYIPDLLDNFGGVSQIDEINDIEGIGDYVASNITQRSPEKSDLWYYDLKLLGDFKSQDNFADLINREKVDPETAIKIISKQLEDDLKDDEEEI